MGHRMQLWARRGGAAVPLVVALVVVALVAAAPAVGGRCCRAAGAADPAAEGGPTAAMPTAGRSATRRPAAVIRRVGPRRLVEGAVARLRGRLRGFRGRVRLRLERRVGRRWRGVTMRRLRRGSGSFTIAFRARSVGRLLLRVRVSGRSATTRRRIVVASRAKRVRVRRSALSLGRARRVGQGFDVAAAANRLDGTVLAVWPRSDRDVVEGAIVGRDGAVQRRLEVVPAGPDVPRSAAVAWNPASRRWVVAWTGDLDEDVYVRQVGRDGAPLDPPRVPITEGVDIAPSDPLDLSCGASNGSCLVAWQSHSRSRRVAVRLLDAAGAPSGPVTSIKAKLQSAAVEVTWNALSKEWLVSWAQGGAFVGQRFTSDGVPTGDPMTLSKGPRGFRGAPTELSMVANPVSGDYLVAATWVYVRRSRFTLARLSSTGQQLRIRGRKPRRSATIFYDGSWDCDAGGSCVVTWLTDTIGGRSPSEGRQEARVVTVNGRISRPLPFGPRVGQVGGAQLSLVAWSGHGDRWIAVNIEGRGRRCCTYDAIVTRPFTLR